MITEIERARRWRAGLKTVAMMVLIALIGSLVLLGPR